MVHNMSFVQGGNVLMHLIKGKNKSDLDGSMFRTWNTSTVSQMALHIHIWKYCK